MTGKERATYQARIAGMDAAGLLAELADQAAWFADHEQARRLLVEQRRMVMAEARGRSVPVAASALADAAGVSASVVSQDLANGS